MGFTGFYEDLPSFARLLHSFTGFYWVLLGFTGFYWVLLGFTGFYWVLLDGTGFLPGSGSTFAVFHFSAFWF